MRLKKLTLENFRNHSQKSYEFDHNLVIFAGQNGIGKTNLLEAIYLLALGKSFRSTKHEDLIEWEKPYLRCNAELELPSDYSHFLSHSHPSSHSDQSYHSRESGNLTPSTYLETFTLELFYSREPNPKRNFKRNGINLKNIEFLGNLVTVLFHPGDLNMLYLEPSLRRRYLDIILSQCSKKYLSAINNYKRVLRQRNALLHQIREANFTTKNTSTLEEDLNAWDKELIEQGSIMIAKRMNFIEFLNKNLEHFYNSIADDENRVTVEYFSKILKNPQLNHSQTDYLHTLYADELFNRRKRDIFQGVTTAGPHRDDLIFYLNGRNIQNSASRGEFRTLLLALKLAEIEFIKKETKKNPILLLDDVFSELDQKRQKQLLDTIKDCQTIITTTDLKNFKNQASDSLIIELDG